MDFSGCHFEYAGVSSRKYNLIFANANTARLTSLMGAYESSVVFNKSSNKNYLIRDIYNNSPISFECEIVSEIDRGIELNERRIIERWLFAQDGYRKLYIDMTDDVYGEAYELIDGITKRLYFNCRFKNPEKLEYFGGIVGYKVTVECDSCMCWQDPIIKGYDVANAAIDSISRIDVNVDTDFIDYIYPKVTITMGDEGGDIIITNETDDSSRQTRFLNLMPLESFMIRGDINYVSEGNYSKFSDKNFVRMRNGANTFSIHGNVQSIIMEWQNQRFI